MTSPARVLFLEVDAGDCVLLRRWAGEGVLPTFHRLLERGLVGDTLAPEGLFVGGIWPTLYTGVSPARHGIHGLVQLVPGTYEFRRYYTGDCVRREPFWNALSRAGRRVAILDIPLSGLSRQINGIQSVEWGSHDANYGFCAWPPDFEAEVRARFGAHPLDGSCNDIGRTPADYAAFRDRAVAGVRRKAELTRHYLRQGGWDFFAQVFTESHCVGHQCWHLHDPTHPAHDPAVTAITGNPLRDVYVAIDAAIGEILGEIGDDARVIVLAGHRMAHKCGAQFLLPEILIRLGVAVAPPERRPDTVDALDSRLAQLWRVLPSGLREALAPVRSRLRGWIDGRRPPMPTTVTRLDAERSHCFLTDNGFPVSGLRLNVAGREPRGLLQPGAEVEKFCAQLSHDLLALVDADTGRPMVASVKRTADLYRGEYLDALPDLLVEWNPEHVLGTTGCGNPRGSRVRVRSERLGLVEGVNHYGRTGDHRREGMFIALGRGIAPGSLGRSVEIADFAPTFCASLGVELPDVDGRAIPEIVAAAQTPRA